MRVSKAYREILKWFDKLPKKERGTLLATLLFQAFGKESNLEQEFRDDQHQPFGWYVGRNKWEEYQTYRLIWDREHPPDVSSPEEHFDKILHEKIIPAALKGKAHANQKSRRTHDKKSRTRRKVG